MSACPREASRAVKAMSNFSAVVMRVMTPCFSPTQDLQPVLLSSDGEGSGDAVVVFGFRSFRLNTHICCLFVFNHRSQLGAIYCLSGF